MIAIEIESHDGPAVVSRHFQPAVGDPLGGEAGVVAKEGVGIAPVVDRVEETRNPRVGPVLNEGQIVGEAIDDKEIVVTVVVGIQEDSTPGPAGVVGQEFGAAKPPLVADGWWKLVSDWSPLDARR